jgi:SAM-dependent methyltransferase
MDSISRFNNKVENYIKYRPGYPEEITDFLKKENVLNSKSVVADIGSGTGKLTELFLKNRNEVFGIEPNDEMRLAAEKLFEKYNNFRSVNGKTKNTKLYDNSIDVITAGQSFHWFNNDMTRKEFKRILKPGGCVVLIWNNRSENVSEFMKDFSQLLNNLETDYQEVKHENLNDNDFKRFFGTSNYQIKSYDNSQLINYNSLEGGILSRSYVPTEGRAYSNMIRELKEIFEKHNIDGKIKIEYKTNIYFSKLI